MTNESVKNIIEEGLNNYYTKTEIDNKIHTRKISLINQLETMGVTITGNPTLSDLVDMVLDIPPSVTGLDLSTSVTCNVDDTIAIGDTVNITGVLSASYDDESQDDVDFNGYLQGANIRIYDDETLLDTVTTNNNGEYISTLTFNNSGTYHIRAVFNGTLYYDDCASTSQNVTVAYPTLNLTSTKSSLSYYNDESTTITSSNFPSSIPNGATVNISVLDKFDDEILSDTVTVTNNNFTYTYESQGYGDITIHIDCLGIVSGSVNIEDCIYCDNATTDKSSDYISVSCQGGGTSTLTYNNGYYVRTGTNGASILYPQVALPTNCILELDVQKLDGQTGIGITTSNGNSWGIVKGDTAYSNRWTYNNQSWNGGESHNYSSYSYTGFLHFEFTKTDMNVNVNIKNSNNEVLLSKDFTLGSYLNGVTLYGGILGSSSSNGAYVKNFKIKPQVSSA